MRLQKSQTTKLAKSKVWGTKRLKRNIRRTSLTKQASTRSKYNAKKVVIDNIKFDSKAEAAYYEQLKLLKMSGEVVSFDLQPEFILQDSFVKNGKKYHAIKYRADFLVRYKDGHEELIDVKGMLTNEFILKRKLFEMRYMQSIKCVKLKGGQFVEV
ncbi:gp58 protein [Listeria monocytogenes]|nr:gp58 protein [Listeria monocytogenes]